MQLKKTMTKSIQEEVMSTYAIPKRDSSIDTTTKEEGTEMTIEKVRFEGRSTVESPTFANDVENDGNRKTCFALECCLSHFPTPVHKETLKTLTRVNNNTKKRK